MDFYYTNEEILDLKEKIEASKTYSEAARKIFSNDNFTSREKVKSIIEKYGFEFEHKKDSHVYCLECGKEITGTNRFRKKFCSHACSAAYNNKLRKEPVYCKNCGKELKGKGKQTGKFCSRECQKEYEYNKRVEKWKNGEDCGYTGKSAGIKDFIKRYLMIKNNCSCQICGWHEKNKLTGEVPLQVHHIDGNCKNNSEENLQLLCPNCHSLTETFGRLNKKSSRKR